MSQVRKVRKKSVKKKVGLESQEKLGKMASNSVKIPIVT